MNKLGRTALLAMGALLASAGSFAGGGSNIGAGIIDAFPGFRRKAHLSKENTPISKCGRGPGWTNAHAKRVARKARNVKRHRAASRSKA